MGKTESKQTLRKEYHMVQYHGLKSTMDFHIDTLKID